MKPVFPFKPEIDIASIRERLAARFGRIRVDQAMGCVGQIDAIDLETVSSTWNSSSLRMRSFVVDTDILRVLQRLGIVGMRGGVKAAYDAMMALADGLGPNDLFELHWHVKSLGQMICTQAKAMCPSCPLSDLCQRSCENITALKSFIDMPRLEASSARTPTGHCEIDSCLQGGLQHGVLHEVFAVVGHETAATGFVAGLAARVAAGKYLLWIRQDFSIHEFGELSPTGLFELGLDPARMILLSVATANDCLRAASDALSCSALGTVVIEIPGEPKVLDLITSRRLTLAAAQKSVTAFLLRFNAQPGVSTAETRWLIRAAAVQTQNEDWEIPVFAASLIRNRHGKTGQWFMEWNCDKRIFQSAAADHGSMVSALAN